MNEVRHLALIAGATNYGDGFPPLPAVKTDLELIEKALQRRGFQVQRVPEADVANASRLENRFRDFCSEGKAGEVRVIYFSGHGIVGPTADSIVPEGTSFNAATQGSAQLVDTNLSAAVEQGEADLVLLIVDACRLQDQTIRPWGARAISGTEIRFVSLLSSSPTAASFTLSSGASAFTQALVNVLAGESSFSLQELQSLVEAECRKLIEKDGYREAQIPTLRHVEDTRGSRDFLLRTWIPEPVTAPQFDPGRLHVVAVQAEGVSSSILDFANTLLRNVSRRQKLWNSFYESWKDRALLSGSRNLPANYEPGRVVLTKIELENAFDAAHFDDTIRSVVEADVALVDGTDFQPGAMFLLGIRAATRRGVTIVSMGDKEGGAFQRPFLLVDVGYGSHRDRPQNATGLDLRFDDFLQRIRAAFDWLRSDSSYADLPLYAALRATRNSVERIRPLGVDQGVLILCSYHDEHWTYLDKHLRPALEDAFFESGSAVEGGFLRFLDLKDPRLVSLGLADQLRRAVACVVDWTGASDTGAPSPSVFFEAGIRAAVNPRGAIHVFAPDRFPKEPSHLNALSEILQPVVYDDVKEQVRDYMKRTPETEFKAPYRRIYNVVSDALGRVMESPEDPITLLERTAQAVRYPDRERELVAVQILFADQNKAVMNSYSPVAKKSLHVAWVYARHTGNTEEEARLKDLLMQHLDLDLDDDLKLLDEIS
ncbi:MAG TPA: caspase family protein [Thermoanaerobaculia bacterium]|nr:caspase family protein [Thermoanaerobaculia bacterium]